MARYAGSLSDAHIRAVARLALRQAGISPNHSALGGAIRKEQRLGQRLTEQVVPERLPALAKALERQRVAGRPALKERLPGMLALGWRQVHLFRSLTSPDVECSDLGLLGATFNAAIAVYDYLLDEPARDWPMPPGALEGLAALVSDVLRDPNAAIAMREFDNDADWSLLFALVVAWADVAAGLYAGAEKEAWPALAQIIGSLLATETLLATGPPAARECADAARWVSIGPALALGLMADLKAPCDGLEARRSAAAYIGEVMWLADDLADLVTDARRGHPNTVLGEGAQGWITDPSVYRKVARGAERLAACLSRPATSEVCGFAHEVAFRWLQWDQHPVRMVARRPTTAAAVHAVEFLLGRQADSYNGDEHILTFPREKAQSVSHETHGGLTFLRATVLDALIDAHEAGLEVPDAVLAAEGYQLLQDKHPSARGGWSYLPGVPELPPDADDLSQILRVLYRLGGPTLAATCDEGVRLTLDAAGPSMKVPTWVLSPNSHGSQDNRMRRCVALVGGGGSHLDVVANLLLALAQTDPVRYREPLTRGARLLASQQSDDGSWPNAWYAGSYHATALAVPVLIHMSGFDDALHRARIFVLAGQGETGGWAEGSAEALTTAQALLTLSALDRPSDSAARDHGAWRLSQLQEPDGGWPAEPWIQFPTRDGPQTYGSRTATTAWALKALLADSHVERMARAEIR